MELSLESAFSPGGMVGHAAYILAVISMLMRSMIWLRVLYLSSTLVGILYVTIWIHDPVGLFWRIVLIAVNIGALLSIWLANRRARFSDEERAFHTALLPGLDLYEARGLFDRGEWIDLPDGSRLTEEGRHPDHLYYIASGKVAILSGGRNVATCGPGHFVGEMSLLDKAPASADARAQGRVRVWRIARPKLADIANRRPKIYAVIEGGIARDMRAKLVRSNAGPEPSPAIAAAPA